MTTLVNQEQKSIPWNQIAVAPDMNIRSDMPKRKEMAESLKANGQLTPVIVTNGGDGDKPYTLVAGNRRMLGFEDNNWKNRDVLCVVREYKGKNIALARLVDNWRENEDREDVSPLDKAERAFQFVNGSYPVLEGETAEAVAKPQVCELLGVGSQQLNNLLRVFSDLDPDVAKKARKANVPLRILINWAGMKGKGKDADAIAESQATMQLEAFENWASAQKELEDAGKKRAPKGKARSKAGESEGSSGVISREKKIASGYKATKKKAGEPVKVDKKYTPTEYVTVFKAKQESSSKEESARMQGLIDAFRFFTGEVAKVPGLTAEDFAILEPVVEEEETAEE